MSAIYTFAFNNVLLFPRTCCERVRLIREEVIPVVPFVRAPVVTPKWRVEIDREGNRRLVEQWIRSEASGGHPAAEVRSIAEA